MAPVGDGKQRRLLAVIGFFFAGIVEGRSRFFVAMNRAILLGLVGLPATVAPGQPVDSATLDPERISPFVFVEVTAQRGIAPVYPAADGMTVGVCAVDFDDDGFIDIFVPTGEGSPHLLYRNQGDGSFVEIAQSVGIDTLRQARAALWFDADGDAKLDLVLLGDCFDSTDPDCVDSSTVEFYRQIEGGRFELSTDLAGLNNEFLQTSGMHRGGAAAGDLNRDGSLDLVFGTWADEARVHINNGDGSFRDESLNCGIGGEVGGHWQPVMHDFNGDGWMDIYWAIDFRANRLWLNLGDGTFVDDAAGAGVDIAFNDMGIALQDFDNDGDADIYITEIFNRKNGRHNPLLQNNSVGGVPAFTDIGVAAGVSNTSWGWGTTAGDFDLDGLLDLGATNGFFNPPFSTDRSRMFRQIEGDELRFADVTLTSGFGDTLHGGGLVSFDADRDGDLDIVQVSPSGIVRFLDNRCVTQSCDANWLVVQPRAGGANAFGVGATLRVTVGGRTMTRYILAGDSSLSQHPLEAHFGLGGAQIVDLLRIEWPDGGVSEYADVAANQILRVP